MSPRAAPSRRQSKAPRTRDPGDKRTRLMQAARELFAERGFAATGTADVARLAGVSEGILFHHFGSKAALLEAVAADYGRGLAQAMFAAAPGPADGPAAEPMLRAAFAYVRANRAFSRLLKLAPEAGGDAGAERATRAEIVAALERGLRAWSEAGQLRPLDSQIAAELLFALVEAALLECFTHGQGEREEDYLREAVACVEGAVRSRASQARSTPNEEILP
jgi:AcrR family transcriptional regulator